MCYKKIVYFIIIVLNSISVFSQNEKEIGIINPKHNWYFGLELGLNTIPSYNLGEESTTFQGGFLVEYYTAKKWSLQSRLKYFKTGVSFKGYNKLVKFDGAVLSVPITIKRDISIEKNINFYFKIGLAANYEMKSNYISGEPIQKEASFFGNFNTGIGINYFMNKKICFYVDLEYYRFGSHKGSGDSFIFAKNYYTDNNLINIGAKYNFTK